VADRQDRRLQPRRAPGASAVDRNVDAPDRAAPRPREPGDSRKPGPSSVIAPDGDVITDLASISNEN
jgi:hypothetical protein